MSNDKKEKVHDVFNEIRNLKVDPEFISLFEELEDKEKLLFLFNFSHKLWGATYELLNKIEVVKIALGLDKTMISYIGKKIDLNDEMLANNIKAVETILKRAGEIEEALKQILLYATSPSKKEDIS